MRRAQAEINRVVGSGRLPTLADRKELPFIDCIMKETWRYVSVRWLCPSDLVENGVTGLTRFSPPVPLGVLWFKFNILGANAECRHTAQFHGGRCLSREVYSRELNGHSEYMVCAIVHANAIPSCGTNSIQGI
jgi:hypothetical protein